MEETMEYLEKRREEDDLFTYDVVIVNDGSKDATTEVSCLQCGQEMCLYCLFSWHC